METTKKLAEAINRLVRPATFPLAVKITETEELPAKSRLPRKHFGTRLSLCQGLSIARRFGFTVGFRPDDHECPIALLIFGLKKESRLLEEEAAMAYPLYAATPEIGKTLNRSGLAVRLDHQPQRKILVCPLDSIPELPDLVLVYGNPAQVNRLVLAATYMTGEEVAASFLGRASCGQSIIKSIQSGKYQVVIPGVGERALALSSDEELIFAIPRNRFAEMLEGLEGSQKAGGFRFPTIYPALFRQPPFHPSYEEVFKEMGLR